METYSVYPVLLSSEAINRALIN